MSLPRSHLWPGVPLAILSAFLFGASTPLAKALLGTVDPWLLAGLLYLGAGLGLAILHGARGALRLAPPEAPLRRSDAPWLAGVVVSGGIVGPLLLMLGLARTDAATASLLLNLESLATMAIAWLAFRENVDRRLLLGAFAILAGALALSWQGRGVALDLGALLIAAALMALGLWLHLAERHQHEHAHQPLEHEHRHVHDEHHRHTHAADESTDEPHTHWHRHEPLLHKHPHYPDLHHRHPHR